MCSKKRDLEIICNLQWKNKPLNGGERSNIVGVYDVPSTTLNWETFKSYLLKNSGTPGDDVKVSYLATNDREFPIQTQLEFQIALYAFRKKARNGEIINLKLDRISEQDKSTKKITSNDVQTQFDTDSNSSLASIETAPQWFLDYMTEFKRDILNEVRAEVSSVTNSTLRSHSAHLNYLRKSRTESNKRCRKNAHNYSEAGNEKESYKKELLKTLKLDKKVEIKLEKLENKSKKLKEKKVSLLAKSSDSDAGQSSSKSNSETILMRDVSQMNAAPVRYQQSVIPHMMGGEVYLHSWDVINNGYAPWTSDTELHFTWGSALLEPVEKIVPCPPLQPGESGTINVLLKIPNACGQYESYWYFHHSGRKFGHWLGCQIIVDNVNSFEPLSNSFLNTYENLKTRYDLIVPSPPKRVVDTENPSPVDDSNIFEEKAIAVASAASAPVEMAEIAEKIKDLNVAEAAIDVGSDSDPKKEYVFVARAPSVAEVGETCEQTDDVSKKETEIEEMIVRTSPSKIQIVEKFLNDVDSNFCCENDGNLELAAEDFKEPKQEKRIDLNVDSDDNNNHTEGGRDSSCSESISKIDEDTSSNSTLNDMVMVNFAEDLEEHDSGYAYVLVDGTKVPIPKRYLRSDFLETAEEAPDPTKFVKVGEIEQPTPTDLTTSQETTRNVRVAEDVSRSDNNNQEAHETESICNSMDANVSDTKSEHHQSCFSEPLTNDDGARVVADRYLYGNLMDEMEVMRREMCDTAAAFSAAATTMGSGPSSFNGEGSAARMDSRVFVFPQGCPGYELIPTMSELAQPDMLPSGLLAKETSYAYSKENPTGHENMFAKYDPNIPLTNLQYHVPNQYNHQSVFTNAPSQPPTANNANFNRRPDSGSFAYVPNYQQTLPEHRHLKREEPKEEATRATGHAPSFPATAGAQNGSGRCSSDRETTARGQSCPAAGSANSKKKVQRQSSLNVPAVMTEAVTMASAAINTAARNVVNMIIPPKDGQEPGVWMNGHWVPTNANSPREANLQALAEMGFWDRDLNATLLARYNDDIAQVVAELIQ